MKKTTIFLITLVLSQSIFSQVLTKKYDRLKQETTISIKINSNITITKYINHNVVDLFEEDTMYQISFYLRDSYLTFEASDIEIVFKDQSRINDNGSVSLSKTSTSGVYGYTYYSYDKSLIEKMSTTNMDGFIMHIWSRELTPQSQELVKKGAKLILNAK
jgi:hypothetical protein